ncbi:probable polypeptide N-acetylgalactosaminyltransferase 8 isoform X2 [Crotalus tigris]|uniref:probable polypeptide N-acetylgalactosaminyltransferase 8 isoform X2 n=1 Tax=Crotalus tigris TaxID=88082 RepID=UPI00192FA0F1|nr:probable polypeptide N-acetylgalactosaminyltransferase 8 isoform X2 [Crotalus tigris]
MVLGRKLPGFLPSLLILLFIVNILFVMHVQREVRTLRREPGGHRDERALDSARENDFVGHLEKIETMFLNLSKYIKQSDEKKKAADELKLPEKPHREIQEDEQGKENRREPEAPPRVRFPDSPLFQRWGKDLMEDQQIVAQQLFDKYGYNVYLSDRLPLERPLKETRHPRCRKKKYSSDLPTLSVILIFFNEATSILLRAITSIINRTPSHLLKEIILIDDCSSNEELKGPLEEHVKKFNAQHPGLLKIVRHQERMGLTEARISGWKASRADVVAILDAHIEVNTEWAEPILSRIKEDHTVIISPVFDNIRFDDFQLTQYAEAADGFDWALWCLYESIPEDWYALKDPTAPIRSPSIMGILAANREFLGKIGVLDGGMHIYGGENVELGIRAWQCSGRVEVLPCSRIAHLERAHKPYLLDLALAVKRNALRVAEVWMDEYKYMVYYAWNVPLENSGIDYGDISSRKELRKRLNCKSFDWYIKNVYPNLVPQVNIVGYGPMKNPLSEENCIDQGPVPGNTPILYICHGYSPQHMFYHSTGEFFVGGIRSRRNTVDRCLTDPGEGKLPVIEQCNEAKKKGLNMLWDFTQGSSVINRKTKRCLELAKDHGSPYYAPVMQNCTGQKWFIQNTVKQWGKQP